MSALAIEQASEKHMGQAVPHLAPISDTMGTLVKMGVVRTLQNPGKLIRYQITRATAKQLVAIEAGSFTPEGKFVWGKFFEKNTRAQINALLQISESPRKEGVGESTEALAHDIISKAKIGLYAL